MEPARLLGACKLGSWARMDSRPRGRRKAFYEGSSKEEGGILGNEVYVNELVEMKMVILRRELVTTTTKCQRATAQLQWRWTGVQEWRGSRRKIRDKGEALVQMRNNLFRMIMGKRAAVAMMWVWKLSRQGMVEKT